MPETDEAVLARAAIAFRAWWDRCGDRLRFDEATGRWTTGE